MGGYVFFYDGILFEWWFLLVYFFKNVFLKSRKGGNRDVERVEYVVL